MGEATARTCPVSGGLTGPPAEKPEPRHQDKATAAHEQKEYLMKNTFKTDVKLGERYRDDQTGIEGVATSIHFYQHACERVSLEYVNKDGDIVEATFDSPRLTSISTGLTAVTTRTGGPARPGERREVPGR